MPATKHKRVDIENTYYHIANIGRENKTLFNDVEDFTTFIGYLNEYLSIPSENPTKKVFTVAGKTFHGVPHLPKNYHKKLELVAYSLIPNTFSLIVKQIEKGSLESFIRSLSTRYSIYFNKKHQRSGQLFDGPCKSKHLKNNYEVTLLTFYLHKRGGQSSIDKYLYAGVPEWLQTPDIKSYNEFILKYKPNHEQQELIQTMLFEKTTNTPKAQTTLPVEVNQKQTKNIAIHQRIPELAFATTFFLILLGFGLMNINSSKPDINTTKPKVAGITTEATPAPIPNVTIAEPEIIGTVTVKNIDPLKPINVYNDIKKSSMILQVLDGVKLDLVEVYNEDWSKVKLRDNIYGFIETKYTE